MTFLVFEEVKILGITWEITKYMFILWNDFKVVFLINETLLKLDQIE